MYKLIDLMNMFNLPERTIRRHLAEKILMGKKVGGSWRFDDQDIADYLDNPQIRISSEKNNIKEAMDYLNGLSRFKDGIMMVANIGNIGEEKMRQLTEVVSDLDYPFYFNISSHGKAKIVTFIGEENDIRSLMEMRTNHG